jgi:hypothetical protein
VSRTSRHYNGVPIGDLLLNAIYGDCSLTFFEPEELVDRLMNLFAYFLTRFKVHQHKLTVLACVKYTSEIGVAQSVLLDIGLETFQM